MQKLFTLVLFYIILTSSINAQPSEGLVAYYPFNGNVNDMSGNGNNGTTNGGCSWVQGVTGQACSFDGSGYISVPNSSSLQSPSTSLSIVFWLNIDSWNNNWAPILAKSNTQAYGQYSVEINSTAGINFWTGTNVSTFNHQMDVGNWDHIAFIWDGTETKFYLNGILKETKNYSGTIVPDDLPLEIGRHFPGSTNDYLIGKLDEILLYNRALTQAEILELYGIQQAEGLVAYYPLNGNANDSSGNGFNGTIQGEVTWVENRFGNQGGAVQLNGNTASFISLPDLELGTSSTDKSFCAWFKLNSNNTDHNLAIIGQWISFSNRWHLTIRRNEIVFYEMVGGIHNLPYTLNVSIDTTNFHFITVVCSDSYPTNQKAKIFLDGQFIGAISSYNINTFQDNYNVGRYAQDYWDLVFGIIDDIRIYNRTLSEAEIQELYHEGGWTGNKKTPVIFIPGIMGSALYNDVDDDNHLIDDERIWIKMFSNMDDLRLAENGIDPFNNNDNIKVAPIRGDNTRTIRNELESGIIKNKPLNVYSDLVQFLELNQNGYHLDDDSSTSSFKNLFIFTYDWRKSINYNSIRLGEYLQNVRNWTNSQQVNLICHSLGGLIAKDLINNLGNNTNIIRKIIFVGTPHLGSPKAFYVTLSGDMLFPITLYTTTEILRSARNYPSGYSLFPSESYYDLNIDNGHSSNVNSYSKTFQKKDEQPMSYSSIKTFFKDVTVHHSLGEDYTFNDALIDEAYITHQNLEITNFGDIEVYNIVAYNNPTFGEVTFYDNSFNYSKTYALANISGDGTVPLRSAELINNSVNTADTTYYITNRWQPIPFNWNTADHGTLLGNAAVLEVIGGLLLEPTYKGPFNNPDIAHNYPLNYGVEWYKQVTVGSPIEVHAYDYDGNHTGPTSDTTWEARIPNSNYLISSITDPNSSKGLILSGDTPAVIKIISRDTASSFDLILNEILDGNNNFEVVFDSVIITPTTVATCSLEIVNAEITLLVDYDGDGNIDTTLIPTSITNIGEAQNNKFSNYFTLEQNYPNPFNPATRIKYSVSHLSKVTIKVFDILGKEVSKLVNEEKPIGTYEINFDASELSSGIYFYQIQAGGFIQTKKMILLK